MTPNHLRPHELDGLRRAGIVPILLDHARGCAGHLADDETLCDICPGCARYGHRTVGRFIAPRAARQPDGTYFCPERRSAGAHVPGASVAGFEGGVSAAEHSGANLPDTGETRKTPYLGGCSVSQRTDLVAEA